MESRESTPKRLLLVHQFPLEQLSGVTLILGNLLELVPRFAPDLKVEYLCLENLGTPEHVIETMHRQYSDVSCILGFNLHIEPCWKLTSALTAWTKNSSCRRFVYVHDYWPHHLEALERLQNRDGWSLLASTEFIRESLGNNGFSSKLAQVGLPLSNIASNYASARNHENPPIIAAAGRLVPRKRFIDLVEAFCEYRLFEQSKLLLKLTPSLVYSIEDDLSQLKEIQTVFEKWDIPMGAVSIERRITAAHDYSRYTLYVAASAYEGFGMTPIEAAYSGCPPFLSDIPPHRAIAKILFGKHSPRFLFPVGDKRALATLLSEELRTGWRRDYLNTQSNRIKTTIDTHWSLEKTARLIAGLI